MSKLSQLSAMTKVVADTGDFAQIGQYKPQDATTNPSLLLKAVMMPEYADIVSAILVKSQALSGQRRIDEAMLDLAVGFGCEILDIIPGRVSTEVDARVSFDTEKTISYAKAIIQKYANLGISRKRVLIKIASTWEGIKAAEALEKEGINCNLTLLFSLTQAIACAQSRVYLISPFVGRITDWYMEKSNQTNFPSVETDQGILSVKSIYEHYKKCNYSTIVMGASFRHVKQIEALAGCDALTIAPGLLQMLDSDDNPLPRILNTVDSKVTLEPNITEAEFRWKINQNQMASEKLAEGIRQFAADTVKLEQLIQKQLITT